MTCATIYSFNIITSGNINKILINKADSSLTKGSSIDHLKWSNKYIKPTTRSVTPSVMIAFILVLIIVPSILVLAIIILKSIMLLVLGTTTLPMIITHHAT